FHGSLFLFLIQKQCFGALSGCHNFIMHQEMGLTVHSIAQLPPFYQKKARKAFSPGTSSEEAGRLQSQNGRWKNGEIGMIAIAIRRRSRYNKSISSQRSGFCPASHP
ncbi:hypothetical protein, partial [Holdemania filiformis]|uniref:hypothetical protein n=1 Tax=Holdemania filiformis TaxID=61171 RepID=UPI0024324A84